MSQRYRRPLKGKGARRVTLPLGKDRKIAEHLIGFTVFEETRVGEDTFSDGLITNDVRWADLSL